MNEVGKSSVLFIDPFSFEINKLTLVQKRIVLGEPACICAGGKLNGCFSANWGKLERLIYRIIHGVRVRDDEGKYLFRIKIS